MKKIEKNLNSILIIAIVLVVFLPFFISQCHTGIRFDKTAQIGDTIGGITAPIIGLFTAYLLYLAFKEQREGNNFTKQDSSFKLIYELLSNLKKEINDFEFGRFKGKEAFLDIHRRLSEAFELFKNRYQHTQSVNKEVFFSDVKIGDFPNLLGKIVFALEVIDELSLQKNFASLANKLFNSVYDAKIEEIEILFCVSYDFYMNELEDSIILDPNKYEWNSLIENKGSNGIMLSVYRKFKQISELKLKVDTKAN